MLLEGTRYSWACYYGRDKAVEMLIRHRDVDLDLNMSDINGCTPLFHAATSGNAACVKYIIDILCKYALSVDVPNFNGITPLMQALRLGHDVCASILVHQGKASTTVRDSNFLSAIDWAARVRGADQSSPSSKKEGFLPVLPVSPKLKKASSKKINQSQAHSDDDDSSCDSCSDSFIFAEVNSSCCSSKSCTTRSSPDIIFGRTPINSPKPNENPDDSDDEDFDFHSENISDTKPQKSEIQKTRDLPQLYNILSNQLSETYRSPGCKRALVARPDTPLGVVHSENCLLECCSQSRASTPMSSRSLPSIIRVPEERIQSMVAAQRKSATETKGRFLNLVYKRVTFCKHGKSV